jgi:signal transduction histidine kinase
MVSPMNAFRLEKKHPVDLDFETTATDWQIVNLMRLALAASVMLAVYIEPIGPNNMTRLTWFIFGAYLLYSGVSYACCALYKKFSKNRLIHRLDVLWFALIVMVTGGADSFYFLFFFFAILTSSFRWGLEEGARITLASAILFFGCSLLVNYESDIARLLLHTIFILVMGYLSVYWGESKLRLVRQMTLLRNVSHLSNPRFGIDQTLTRFMEQTMLYFKASSCILIEKDQDSGIYYVRTVKAGEKKSSFSVDNISEEMALPLMARAQNQVDSFTRARACWSKSIDKDKKSNHEIADFLNAYSFISASMSSKKGIKRLYLISQKIGFSPADGAFLKYLIEQIQPVMENIDLLDKMASQAAGKERRKISLDIHDATIQPYIGLKFGLSALRNKAAFDNPLLSEIDKLMIQVEKVIGNLRQYALSFNTQNGKTESIFFTNLHKQAAEVKDFYGIDIVVNMDKEINISDRLAIEALQLVREGLSNICKHTVAQKGSVHVQFENGLLKIKIENENIGHEQIRFTPRSISERVSMLGGVVVNQMTEGTTGVWVEIPV